MSKPFSIAIHGGTGNLLREHMSLQLHQAIFQDLEQAVRAGSAVLENSGTAINAVVAAVKILEDSPYFNAGKGSVLTEQEMVEMEASLMDGREQKTGAIAGVRHIKNPIELARDVMQSSEHVFLIGDGAEAFAFEQDHQYTEQDYFYTEERYQQLQQLKQQSTDANNQSYSSVGAVALDQYGNLAAATSSGGIANKKYGRVGEAALIDVGVKAENDNVAVSTASIGESFIQKGVAGEVAARMRYLQEGIATACDSIIQDELKEIGAKGGLIAIDSYGKVHFSCNCTSMYRASIDIDGNLDIGMDVDD